MYINELIERLEKIREEEGNLMVTCTGTFLDDGYNRVTGKCNDSPIDDVFESTVGSLKVQGQQKGKFSNLRTVRINWV